MSLIAPNNNDLILQVIADRLETAFGGEKEQFLKALSVLNIIDIKDFLQKTQNFFRQRKELVDISIDDLQDVDLRKLAYEFIAELNITNPAYDDPLMKAGARDILGKLGRLFLHDILFPELIAANPSLAYSVKNLLKKMVRSIAITEGVGTSQLADLLILDEIDIPLTIVPVKQIEEQPKDKHQLTLKEYIKPGAVDNRDLEKLARQLQTEFFAITKKSSFLTLVGSDGEDFEPMEIRSGHVKLIVHLFYCMFHPSEKNCKPILIMNKGKGSWNFLQENIIIVETGNTIARDLRKISSDINNQPGHEKIIEDVAYLLHPIYKKQKIKL